MEFRGASAQCVELSQAIHCACEPLSLRGHTAAEAHTLAVSQGELGSGNTCSRGHVDRV